MRRIWIEILNEIVNAKNEITMVLKLSRRDIIVEIGNYKKIIRKFPHLATIEKLIERLRDAGCVVDEIAETLDGTSLTEKYTYIIRKPNSLTAKTKSTFLYDLNDGIEMEYIDGEYTGNVIPKQTGCIIQKLVVDSGEYTINIDINSIDDQHYTLITLRVRLKEKENAINNLTNIVYDSFNSNLNVIEYAIIDNGFSQEIADTAMPLLKLYLKYL